jgi:hypothetical protein
MVYTFLTVIVIILILIVLYCYYTNYWMIPASTSDTSNQGCLIENLSVNFSDNVKHVSIFKNQDNTNENPTFSELSETNTSQSPSPCTGKDDCKMCKDTNNMTQCPKCGKTNTKNNLWSQPSWSSSNLDSSDDSNNIWDSSTKPLDGIGSSDLCSYAKVSFEPSTQQEKEQMRLNPAFMNLGVAR